MGSDVRQKLIDVAKREETITYGQLMKEFRIPRGSLKLRVWIESIFGIIKGLSILAQPL